MSLLSKARRDLHRSSSGAHIRGIHHIDYKSTLAKLASVGLKGFD